MAQRTVGILEVGVVLVLGSCGTAREEVQLLEGARAVEFQATVNSRSFHEGDELPGYHLIVWRRGRSAGGGLFVSGVGDTEVLEALESLGAVPGDALGIDTWDERFDEASSAPDRVIEGPRVKTTIRLATGETLRLADILDDPGGRGFEMRFGGHRGNIAEWRSGCVACLYSCPGSKVGNARYTVRDYVEEATRFRVRPGVLPPDGSEVTVRFTLEEGSRAR